MIYIKVYPSILGARVIKLRYPHKKSITNISDIDKILGTYNGVARSFPNQYFSGFVNTKKVSEEFIFTFDRLPKKEITLNLIDNQDTYLFDGDIRRYGFDHENLLLSDIDLVPHLEDDYQVSFKAQVEYRILEKVK